MNVAIFPDRESALRLYLLWHLFGAHGEPPGFFHDSDGEWGVPLKKSAGEWPAGVDALIRALGIEVRESPALPQAGSGGLAELIEGRWRRAEHGQTGPFVEGRLRPAKASILAADSRERAGTLIAQLAHTRAPGLRAAALTPCDGKKAPAFLCRVEPGLPEPRARDAASRVWWGPVLQLNPPEFELFFEWPCQLSLQIDPLRRAIEDLVAAGFAPAGGLMLLGPSGPPLLARRDPQQAGLFHDLIDCCEKVVPGRQFPVTAADAAPPAEQLPIAIEISLEEKRGPHAERLRLERVEKRIEALKREQAQLLRRQKRARDLAELRPEPLYIYSSRPGEIPQELKRLLLDCGDDPIAFRELRYLRLRRAPLPEWNGIGEGDLHFVTPARVFEPQQREQLSLDEADWPAPSVGGLRLLQHPPLEGRWFRHRLLGEWAQYGLALFVPEDRPFEIHPPLMATTDHAKKLEREILPEHWRLGDAIYVLIPGDVAGAPLCCVALPRSEFQPLGEALRWQLRSTRPRLLPVETAMIAATHSLAAASIPAGARLAFEKAEAEVVTAIDRQLEELKARKKELSRLKELSDACSFAASELHTAASLWSAYLLHRQSKPEAKWHDKFNALKKQLDQLEAELKRSSPGGRTASGK